MNETAKCQQLYKSLYETLYASKVYYKTSPLFMRQFLLTDQCDHIVDLSLARQEMIKALGSQDVYKRIKEPKTITLEDMDQSQKVVHAGEHYYLTRIRQGMTRMDALYYSTLFRWKIGFWMSGCQMCAPADVKMTVERTRMFLDRI